jgi:hypothetical protein
VDEIKSSLGYLIATTIDPGYCGQHFRNEEERTKKCREKKQKNN